MKKTISLTLILMLFFINIPSVFAAEEPPPKNPPVEVISVPAPKLAPVEFEVDQPLEIDGQNAARIQPIPPDQSEYLSSKLEQTTEANDKVTVISKEAFSITDKASAIPDAAEPNASKPDAVIPDAAQPDATTPDTAQPDAATPDAAIPDAAEPDVTIPDAPEPDAATPDAAEPDVTILDAAKPDAAITAAALPDLTVYDLKPASGQATPFVALSDTKIQFTIANIGKASSGNFTIGIVVDNVLMGTLTENLAANTGTIYTVNLQQVPEGNHAVRIVGDYSNTVSESNESNNSAGATYLWVGKPNFKADYLTANRTSPFEAGTNVQYSFKVSNSGNGNAAGKSYVVLRVNGETLVTWTVTDWRAQTYLQDSINLSFNQAGSYTVEIRVDPDNLVAESNEKDNAIANNYTVTMASKIKISGYITPSFRYAHTSGATAVTTPLKGFKVKLIDQDVAFDDEIATTYTNSNGYFEVTVNNQSHENGIDLFLRLDFDDDVTSVRTGNNGGVYRLETSVIQDIQVGTVDFGVLPLTNLSADIEGAFSIWHWIHRGYDYYAQNSGASLPKVNVNWASGVGTGASHSGTTINIGGDTNDPASCDGDIILHEYGHHIMANTVGRVPGSGGSHTYTTPSNLAMAYSEAWAHYFSTSVRNTSTIKDTNPSSWFGANLETPAFINSSGTNSTTPLEFVYEENAKYELNVAAVLWDLFDSASDGVDVVSHSFRTVDSVMRSSSNRDVYDFYDRWQAASGSSYSKETNWSIFESRKNSRDLQVPVVTLSTSGNIIQATATDNVAVKKYEWYVDGTYHSQGTGAVAVFNTSVLSPGLHAVQFRAYDPEGLLSYSANSGNPNRPRAARYGSASTSAFVASKSMSDSTDIATDKTKAFLEDRNRLVKSVPAQEKIVLNESQLLRVNDNSRYRVLVGKNEDLRIYSHILGAVKNVDLIAPNGTLYQSYDYISPDQPIVIPQAEPGEWTIQVNPLTQKDLKTLNIAANTAIPETPLAIVATTVPSPVELEVPEITNNPALIANQFNKMMTDSSIKLSLNGNRSDSKLLLKEGLNQLSVSRVNGKYTSESRDYSITLDTTAPDIRLVTAEQIITTDDSIIIQGTVDSDVQEVTINGTSVQLSEFVIGFAQDFSLKSGLNHFTIKAVDRAGNVTQKTITVTKS